MRTLYQSLGDTLMQSWKVNRKLLEISKFFAMKNMKYYIHYSP